MNSKKRIIALMSFMFLTGCGAVEEMVEGDEDPPNAVSQEALTSFELDSSALTLKPSDALPELKFNATRFSEANIASSLLKTQQRPLKVVAPGKLEMFKTNDWEFEKDAIFLREWLCLCPATLEEKRAAEIGQ